MTTTPSIQTANEHATNQSIKPSYMRSIDIATAAKMKWAIDVFFGGEQPTSVEVKKQQDVKPSEWRRWFIPAGILLLVAGASTWFAKVMFPTFFPLVGTGFYLGLIGLGVIFVSAVRLMPTRAGAELRTAQPPQVENPAMPAIRAQIDHIGETYADFRFGPRNSNSRRVLLQGIGRREWNDNHDIPVTEPTPTNQIYAAVVHLVAIDLTPPFVSVRQWGLDLRTGTICDEWAMRHPLYDIISISRRTKTAAVPDGWTRANELLAKISSARDKAKPSDKLAADIKAWETELGRVEFDRQSGTEFELTFLGGDKVVLKVSDAAFAKNTRAIAHPIGGPDNLARATATWDAIEKARLDAEHRIVMHREELSQSAAGTTASLGNVDKGIAGVQAGLRDYQSAVVTGLGNVRGDLGKLEGVMTEVLSVLQRSAPAIPKAPIVELNGPSVQGGSAAQ